MGYTVKDLYEALGKMIANGHGDSSVKTTDQEHVEMVKRTFNYSSIDEVQEVCQ